MKMLIYYLTDTKQDAKLRKKPNKQRRKHAKLFRLTMKPLNLGFGRTGARPQNDQSIPAALAREGAHARAQQRSCGLRAAAVAVAKEPTVRSYALLQHWWRRLFRRKLTCLNLCCAPFGRGELARGRPERETDRDRLRE